MRQKNCMKNTINKDEDLQDPGGLLTEYSPGTSFPYKLRELMQYCKDNNKDIEKLTDEELERFKF